MTSIPRKIAEWMKRNHKHPVNIVLHILGPILVIVGILMRSWILVLIGAVIMPLGHLFEKRK